MLRLCGAAMLMLALAAAMIGLGAAYGAISWCGHIMVAAAIMLTGLTLRRAR